MSGIAGLVRFDGAPTQVADIGRMLARLAHRGPDDAGVWCDGGAGLGHRLLHTTPDSLREHQPLASRDGALILTADARIDNRAELIAALGCSPDSTDAELIPRAYERWGERCPEHLLGDFAFALWDAPRATLFCARDHFGVKPFHYHHRPGRLLAFASEIKGLLVLADVPRRLNEARVADYLVPSLEDKVMTFYEGIERLPPAHWMTVTREGMRIEQYWALDPEREIRLTSDAEYAEAFRETFTEAVRCRLRSAFPLGSMLSGGLDSSSIVCVARQLLAENGGGSLHTFSAIFPDVPECDEREYIEAVVAGGRVEPHYVRGDALSPVARLDEDLAHQDEPFYAPNLFLHGALYREAASQGVRVLLDGLDGDTTVSHGIGYLRELAGAGRWVRLIREVRGLSRQLGARPRRILLEKVVKPLLPEAVLRSWAAVRRPGTNADSEGVIAAGFAQRIGLTDRSRTLRARGRAPPRTEREDHYRTLGLGLIPLILEVADRAAHPWHLEPRYPYFDKRLVELCLALPGDQKLRHGWTRVVQRHAMERVLPPKIQWRPGKADLSANFLRGLLNEAVEGGIRGVSANGAGIAGYVDLAGLRKAYERALSPGGERAALTVWRVLVLNQWLEACGLGPTREEVTYGEPITQRRDQASTRGQVAV